MKMMMRRLTPFLLAVPLAFADPLPAGLRKNVTFHASFDKKTPDADTARGDAKIYHAPDFDKQLDKAAPGFGDIDVEIDPKAGLHGGGALRFKSTNKKALFFRGAKHIATSGGTFSFWLRLDPLKDLWPSFSDPIQLTDGDYNNRAMWVDFSKDERPRWFRLGAFGELQAWNKNYPAPEKNPDFTKRLIVVKTPPFTREAWTHVAIVWSGLGSAKGGTAALYVNGQAVAPGPASVPEAFVWTPERLAIRLGLNYTGHMDELAAFDRPLTAAEVESIHQAGLKP